MYRPRFLATGAAVLVGFLCFLVIGAGCARFRIEELQPEIVFSFPVERAGASNPSGRLQLEENGRVPFNLPLRPAFSSSQAFLADPGRQLVRVYSLSGDEPRSLLAADGAAGGDSDVERAVVRGLGIPGWISADESGTNVYVQSFAAAGASEPPNLTDQTVENRPSNELSILRRSGSRILQLDANGQLVRTLGVGGAGAEPFPAIERMTADADGRLHVLYRDAENQPVLAQYQNGERLNTYAPSEEFLRQSGEDFRRYYVDWEDIAPGPEGSFAIFSVALRRKGNYDLAQRIIYRQNRGESGARVALRTDDPADYFLWPRPDGGFYMRNSEEDGSRMLFKIFSPDGEYLNNRLIVFPGLRASWRDTFLDIEGRIFSARLYLGRFELYEWK